MTDNELNVFTNYLEKKFHISTDKNSYQQTSRDIVDAILELTRYTRASQIPSMAGNSGKFLTTNGTTTSWGTVSIPPAISKYLKTDADLNTTTQLVKDALGISSRFKLGTTRAAFFGNDFTGMGVNFKPSWVLANDDTESFGIAAGINVGNYGFLQGFDSLGAVSYRIHLQPFGGEVSFGPSTFADTYHSITSKGSTSGTNALKIKNSALTEIFNLHDLGGLEVSSIKSFTSSHTYINNFDNSVSCFYLEDVTGNIGVRGASVAANGMTVYGKGITNATSSFQTGDNASGINIRAFDNKDTLIAAPLYIGESNGSISNYAARLRSGGANIFHLEATAYGAYNTILNMGLSEASISQVTESLTTNGSVLFGVNSITKGFRTPRMTTAQFTAIVSKAQGLEAFSTDGAGKLWYDGTRTVGFRYNGSAFQGYNGSSWANIATALQYWTESYTIGGGGYARSGFTAIGADAHIHAVIVPKGLGGIHVAISDNTTTGGNIRGINSVDLQTVRGVAADVASGAWSVLLGGQENRASGPMSVVSGGYVNRATAQGASVPGGMWADAYLYGMEAKSSGAIGVIGDTQKSSLTVARLASSVNAASNPELFLDVLGALAVPNGSNRAWNVTIRTTAVCTVVGSGSGTVGDVYTSTYTLGFKRVGGIVSLVTAATLINSSSNAGMAGASMSITAGASNNLKIEWTAPTSATGTTFRICSAVDLVEVAW